MTNTPKTETEHLLDAIADGDLPRPVRIVSIEPLITTVCRTPAELDAALNAKAEIDCMLANAGVDGLDPTKLDALARVAETGAQWAEICRLEAEAKGGPFFPTEPATTAAAAPKAKKRKSAKGRTKPVSKSRRGSR